MFSAVTIGNFDGVHRGHRVLIESVQAWRRENAPRFSENLRTSVITFEPHPIEVLRGSSIARLSSAEEKIRLLRAAGMDTVDVIPFDSFFAQMEAEDFFHKEILQKHQTVYVSVGENFCFGKDRKGTAQQIVAWSEAAKIEAKIISAIQVDSHVVSSSRIRELIESGHMIPASRLLGRDYSLSGEVIHGDKKGRLLGFPTANIKPQIEGMGRACVPAKGVYLSVASIEGRTFPSITNVGVKPTLSQNSPLLVETHILGFDGDLYGSWLTVEFRDRLRDERRFRGLDELKQQIQIDVETARLKLGLC